MIKNSIMQSSSRKRLNSGDNDATNGGRDRLDSLGSSNQDANQNKDSVVALTQYAKRKPSVADGEGLLPNLKTSQKLRNGGFQIDIGIKNSRGGAGGSDIDHEIIQIGGSHMAK